MHVQISEHFWISAYTGKSLSVTTLSSVLDHPISLNDFSVSSSCPSTFEKPTH